MTPLVIRCRNTLCVSKICGGGGGGFSQNVAYPCKLSEFEFFLFFTFYWINHIVFIRFISLFKIVFDYIIKTFFFNI